MQPFSAPCHMKMTRSGFKMYEIYFGSFEWYRWIDLFLWEKPCKRDCSHELNTKPSLQALYFFFLLLPLRGPVLSVLGFCIIIFRPVEQFHGITKRCNRGDIECNRFIIYFKYKSYSTYTCFIFYKYHRTTHIWTSFTKIAHWHL